MIPSFIDWWLTNHIDAEKAFRLYVREIERAYEAGVKAGLDTSSEPDPDSIKMDKDNDR